MPSKSRAQQHRKRAPAYPRLLKLFPVLALVVLGCVAYWNSTDGPFVFDDLETIQRNAGVRFGEYFSASLLRTRSLLFLTFAINNWVGGQNVFGYHLVNLVLHILNGILIFTIAFRIFRNTAVQETTVRMYALCAAAFFLVYPVQTESLQYLSSWSHLLSPSF